MFKFKCLNCIGIYHELDSVSIAVWLLPDPVCQCVHIGVYYRPKVHSKDVKTGKIYNNNQMMSQEGEIIAKKNKSNVPFLNQNCVNMLQQACV